MYPARYAAFIAILAAGCLGHTAEPSEAQHQFGASFDSHATQSHLDEFRQRMKAHNGETLIMESFPPQFLVNDFGLTDCSAARDEATSLHYVASTTGCRPVAPGPGGDQAASTTAN